MKIRKNRLIIAIAIILLIMLGGCEKTEEKNITPQKIKSATVIGKRALNGNIVLPDYKGHITELKEEKIKEAYLTPDRSKIVWIDNEGILKFKDRNKNETYNSNSVVHKIYRVTDTAVLYKSADKRVKYWIFDRLESRMLNKDIDAIVISADGTSVAYLTSDHQICVMKNDGYLSEVYVTTRENAFLGYISDDGNTVVYGVDEGDYYKILVWEAEQVLELGNISSKNFYVKSAYDGCIYIYSDQDNKMWIKETGKDPIQIECGLGVWGQNIYCDEGLWVNNSSLNENLIYASILEGDKKSLISISREGDKKTILENIGVFDIAGGTISYVACDKEEKVYCAEINNGKLSLTKAVADKAERIRISDDGKYVYYVINDEEVFIEGELNCFYKETGENLLIAQNVFAVPGIPWPKSINLTEEGVIFEKDMLNPMGEWQENTVTLMRWNAEKRKLTEIDDNVIFYSISSGLENDVIDQDHFTYAVLKDVDENKKRIVNWRIYNLNKLETIFDNSKISSYSIDCYWE